MDNNNLLEIKDLHVNAGEKEILKGIDLNIKKGEIHVIMGPNGSGKTTTANAILNNPEYTKTNGTITFDGEDIARRNTRSISNKLFKICKKQNNWTTCKNISV